MSPYTYSLSVSKFPRQKLHISIKHSFFLAKRTISQHLNALRELSERDISSQITIFCFIMPGVLD